ncbi:MAG: hypothetical protein ACR2RB_06600 [Gammaproteobacteria bacterium]
MTKKQKLIKQMLELQARFSEYERKHGLNPSDYYDPPADHPLSDYREQYDALAKQLVDLAHEEKGSHR